MNTINYSILGSGLSALVTDYKNPKSIIFTNNEKKIKKSKRFYEYQYLGGNSNLWGGYVNYKRYKKLLENKNFKNFMANNSLFEVKKFLKNETFNSTYYLSEKNNNKVFRAKNDDFRSEIIPSKINKLILKKNYMILQSNNNSYKTKKVSICIGNLGLLELLYKSNLLKKNDEITFYDGNVSYSLNLFLNHKKNYYIPMSLNEISKKLIYGKIMESKENIKKTLIVQKYSRSSKKYTYSLDEILKYKTRNLRYFLSNHIVGIEINKIPIKKYINDISSEIKINCSGTIAKYIPGPISQDIIFNSLNN